MSRRMFNSRIVESDPFLSMSLTAQALYFHLSMHADDEGFVYPKGVMKMCGAGEDDLNNLLARRFVLAFENGVCVVKAWNVNNQMRADRIAPTAHKERSMLRLDEAGNYHLIDNVDAASAPPIRELGSKLNSSGQSSIKDSIKEIAAKKKLHP